MFVSYMAKIKVVLLCHLFLFCTLFKSSAATDTLNSKSSFEVSFGQSLLFFSNSDLVNIRDKTNLVMPTSSMLFFAEFRCNKAIRIPTFFNLPTETKQFVDPLTKATVYEKPSPSIGTGLEYKLLQIKIDSKTKIEFEAGPLAAFILDKKKLHGFPTDCREGEDNSRRKFCDVHGLQLHIGYQRCRDVVRNREPF